MIKTFDQLVLSSFKEFLSYQLQNELRAFKNTTVSLYPYSGSRKFKNKTVYSTNKAQWLYDSSLSGVQIPSGIDGLERGQSGLSFDFKNGRVMVDSGVQLTGQLNVSVPDFNFYITTLPINKIIAENNFGVYPDFTQKIPRSDSLIAPCIIVGINNASNKQHFVGGIQKSNLTIQIVGLSSNLSHLIGLQKIVRDLQDQVFPLLSLIPFDELNDLKSEYWNYTWVQDWLGEQSNLVLVENSKFKFADIDYINTNLSSLLVGIGEVQIAKVRNNYNIEDTFYDIPYYNLSQYIYKNSDQVYILD